MSEKELNEKYIRDNIQGICQDCMYLDKIIPVINKMLSEAYIKGLRQGKFDNQMEIIELQSVIDEAIKYIENCNPNVDLNSMFLNESYISNYGACELLKILKGENNV